MWTVNEVALGTIGFEYGRILLDIEYLQEARICLEKDTQLAPFTSTGGMYRLLFHTIFCSDEEYATQKIRLLKKLTLQTINAVKQAREDDLNKAIDAIVQL